MYSIVQDTSPSPHTFISELKQIILRTYSFSAWLDSKQRKTQHTSTCIGFQVWFIKSEPQWYKINIFESSISHNLTHDDALIFDLNLHTYWNKNGIHYMDDSIDRTDILLDDLRVVDIYISAWGVEHRWNLLVQVLEIVQRRSGLSRSGVTLRGNWGCHFTPSKKIAFSVRCHSSSPTV